MTDPLSLLRKYNVSHKSIYERGNQIIFGEYSWPKTAKTNYLVWRSGENGTPKEYYTLESLIFLLKNVLLPHPVYVGQAIAENIPVVRRPARKALLAYLNGDTSASSSIDKSAPIENPTTVKRVFEEQNQQKIAKKLRLEFSINCNPSIEEIGTVKVEDMHEVSHMKIKEEEPFSINCNPRTEGTGAVKVEDMHGVSHIQIKEEETFSINCNPRTEGTGAVQVEDMHRVSHIQVKEEELSSHSS